MCQFARVAHIMGGSNNRGSFSHSSEAGSQRSRCQSGWFLLRPLSLVLGPSWYDVWEPLSYTPHLDLVTEMIQSIAMLEKMML